MIFIYSFVENACRKYDVIHDFSVWLRNGSFPVKGILEKMRKNKQIIDVLKFFSFQKPAKFFIITKQNIHKHS